MHIKSYKSTRFAGLKDFEIEFEEGLNVILGPNESGKSTIIEGIHATLFKDIKLRRNNTLDRDFNFRFMPKPSGDFINGKVVLKSNNGTYKISKEWGSSESIELVTSEGNIFRNEAEVKDILDDILYFGESTYSNIVFAKQRELKASLSNILNNREITQEINHVLRMALMELDGISIDSIQENIDKEIDDLYKRWDKDKNYPENNRGVNNPYKVGLGKIIESYYKKENLKLKMEEADKSEKEFEEISNNIKELKRNKEELSKERIELEKIEDDVSKGAIINAKKGAIKAELDSLMKINRDWPMGEHLLEQMDKDLNYLNKKKETLNNEKKDLEKLDKKEDLLKKLARIEKLENQIMESEEVLLEIPLIEQVDIDKITKLQQDILTIKTTMKAGKMIGILKNIGNKPIYISKDFNEKEILEKDKEFDANGIIHISDDYGLQLEIKTGEIDFEQLNKEYISLEKEFKELLIELKIDSIETGKLNLHTINNEKDNIKNHKKELEIILDDNTKEGIQKELEELKDIKVFRNLEEIENELEEIMNKEIQLSGEKSNKLNELKSWEEKFETHDLLIDLVIEKRTEFKEMEEGLEGLQPLPEKFETVEDFRDRLSWLKNQLNLIESQFDSLNIEYYNAKNNLSDETYEELKKEYLEAEKAFNRNIKRGDKLLEIKRVFLETKERLASNPMESLVAEFTRLLEIITSGRYKTGDIDEEFNLKLENPNGEIPIELLSAGTQDSVTLALRFALLKHIFNDRTGYVILDDCLVDLDPIRKWESVKLINDFAKDYQIIFTTCNPETAKMLGGRIIEL